MNDSKWEKLISKLTDEIDELFIHYKLIYSDELFHSKIDCVDTKPFFIEPIFYKEVEWIEFPKEYSSYKNPNNLKAGTSIYLQDLILINEIIESTGSFDIEIGNNAVKLRAYR